MKLMLIGLGGALGTLLRYGAGQLARRVAGDATFGTLAVNVVGCFVLGLVIEAALRGARMGEELRLALSVGVCGGLTTYSSFNQEALGMLRGGQSLAAIAYVVVTLALCAAAAMLGLVVARVLVSSPP